MRGMGLKSLRDIEMGRCCVFGFVGLSGQSGGEDYSEDSEWGLGEVMIVSVRGSSPIE